MRIGAAILVVAALALAACTTTPPAYDERLFNDGAFAAPTDRVDAGEVFALTPEMRQYLKTQVASRWQNPSRQQALVDALSSRAHLKLTYDSEWTRNAAETFAARAGNCLSLVIMTAALAHELGIPVRYQMVLGDTVWSRSGGMYFSISHVNITLGAAGSTHMLNEQSAVLTVDFLPGEDLRGERVRVVTEETILAMYMNNRAAESIADGRLDNAYWWARAALRQDPKFTSAYNTLGVVYRRHGDTKSAEKVLAQVLELEPANTQAMSNLALVLTDQGRQAEAAALTQKLAALQPYPPFYFFDRGLAAMRERDYKEAKVQFEREIERDAYYHEFRFWLAAAYLGLGETAKARAQLSLALDNSTTRGDRDLYAAKLDWIRHHRTTPSIEGLY
jgi:Tfp pilus assembly protein PilF